MNVKVCLLNNLKINRRDTYENDSNDALVWT